MKRLVSVLVVVSLLIGGCSKKTTTKSVYGTLSNSSGESITLNALTPEGPQTIEITTIDENGNFSFVKPIDRVGFYQVFISEQNFATIVLDSAQQVEITGNAKDLGNTHRVKGSLDAELFWQMNEASKNNYRSRDSLTQVFQAFLNGGKASQTMIDSLSNVIDKEFNGLVQKHTNYLIDFVTKNPQSLSAIAAIQQLSSDNNFEQFEKVNQALKNKYPTSSYIKLFSESVEKASKLRAGSDAPEIVLNEPSGKPLALSSLRGKVVLLDFWASWCAPCRATNPQVVALYDKFKNKDFEIYAVSLDENKDKWIEAIAKDRLTWKHVSELKSWKSAVVEQYNFKSIPYNVLIGKDGKIVAKNLHDTDLENKVKELLGE
ncbi:MAG: TlpA family protein disulfide reductase [Bacteroidetes bacterium]|nr:TlpA family protein disulfide reductase [Bacteroidota bacterium]